MDNLLVQLEITQDCFASHDYMDWKIVFSYAVSSHRRMAAKELLRLGPYHARETMNQN